ncbi:MAG: DUF401 family protein [Planctomycetes bacterium]|nr:DUF401 family protein [Planctomycetota bacterium]
MILPPTPLSSVCILTVLLLMAYLIYRKVDVPWVLLAATGCILLLFYVSPVAFMKELVDPAGTFLGRTVKVVVLIYLINLLGNLLKKSGQEEILLSGLESSFGDRRAVAAITPMAMGLLPMPGGALLSASMVEMTLGDRCEGGFKAAVNMWFRHVWELVDPLYPAVILSVEITGIRFGELVLANSVTFWAMLLFGALLLLRRIERVQVEARGSRSGGLVQVARVLLPVGVAFAVTFLDTIAGDGWLQYVSGPVPGVAAGVIAGVLVWRCSRQHVKRAALAALDPRMIFVVVFALMLATALNLSGAVEGMRADLDAYDLPAALMIVVLPVVTGFLTGIGVGFASMTLPIVAALSPEVPGGLAVALPLAYGMGFLGVLFSPVHLCLLLSAEKFETDLPRTYRWMVPSGLAVVAMLVLRSLGVMWLPGLLE